MQISKLNPKKLINSFFGLGVKYRLLVYHSNEYKRITYQDGNDVD